jgi:Ca2+-binding EF-hand superfamily protein
LEAANKQNASMLSINEANFKQFQASARKRRILKKKRTAEVEGKVRDGGVKLAQMLGKPFVENTETYQFYQQLKDTFNAFDRDGSAELEFPEYLESWRFLDQPGTDADVKRTFDGVDVDGSGFVEWDEYVFSIMGEKANDYGPLCDLERLTSLLGDMTGKYEFMLTEGSGLKESAEDRAKKNALLRARLDNVKKEVTSTVNALLSQMMNCNPEDLMTDEEINKHLTEAFNKFDEDRSGQLGQWEFQQAWFFLGLKGTEMEIKEAFKSVDTNNSGLVDLAEFKEAIRGERLLELNLKSLFDQMGVEYNNSVTRFAAFKATEKRRRLMKKEWEAKIGELSRTIIEKLASLSKKPVPTKNSEDMKVYKTLKDTFNAFDNDGSAELGYPEYVEAWKFLNRPGDEKEIKLTFDSVDVDKSGIVDWSEFAFSLMGAKALQFGPLADLETLNELLEDTAHLLSGLRADLDEAMMNTAERKARNNDLKNRLKRMKKDMGSQMGNLMGKMMSIFGQDPAELLSDEQIERVLNSTFKKFDKDGSGELEMPEFIKAWRFLDLQGDDEEVKRAFHSVDVDNSGIVERREFVDAIKGARMAELSLSVLMTQMDGHLEGLEDIFTDFKRKQEEAKAQAAADLEMSKGAFAKFQATAKRRRLMKKQYEEQIAEKTHELVVQLKDIA